MSGSFDLDTPLLPRKAASLLIATVLRFFQAQPLKNTMLRSGLQKGTNPLSFNRTQNCCRAAQTFNRGGVMKTIFEKSPLWGIRLFIICSVIGIWGCSPPNREVNSSLQSKSEPLGESVVEPALEQPRHKQVKDVEKSLSNNSQPKVIKNVREVNAKQPPANVSPVQKEDRLSLISSANSSVNLTRGRLLHLIAPPTAINRSIAPAPIAESSLPATEIPVSRDDEPRVNESYLTLAPNEGYATMASTSQASPPPPKSEDVVFSQKPVVADATSMHPSIAKPTESIKATLDTSYIDNVLKRLVVGNVTYNWPEKIPTNGWTTIELLIGAHKTPEELKTLLAEIQSQRSSVRGLVMSSEAKLSNKMQASLTGPDFDIKPSDPVVKPLAGIEPTVWEWTVKPKVSGTLLLTMKLEAIITDGQIETPWVVQTWEKNIEVETSLWETFKEFLNQTLFKPENLWTWIVLPVLGVMGMLLKKGWKRFRANVGAAE
ncbi:hypothetical protein [Pseudomonas sp. NFACC02]|uniref:hypothetical protein n=1 Tax=Pseudomonas sp. NFACC02 TaxID=1566250 RepID=UPI00111380C5|nr:hypothetical protein [Pseudomonas sp. NFACC02]